MKTCFVTLIAGMLLFSCLHSQAQFKTIAEGPKFEKPEEGFAKILQLKNGNTFYIHITMKDGINIRIYDARHKEKISKTLNPSYTDLIERDDIKGIFEINNDVIVLVNREDEDKIASLYRLIIDGNTGNLKKQQIIGRCKYKWRDRPDLIYTFFYVSKDPASDNYALAMLNGNEKDNTKQLEIVHYGSDNNEINRQFCSLPDKKDAISHFNEMIVMGKEKICLLLTFSWKAAEKRKSESQSKLVIIEKGKATVEYTDLNLHNDLPTVYCMGKYNRVINKIMYISATLVPNIKTNNQYNIYLDLIDPVTKQIQNITEFGHSETLNKAYKEILDLKTDYRGMPQNIIINSDGSFTVLFEEMEMMFNGQSGGSFTIGTLAITNYNKEGIFQSDYLIPKAHWVVGDAFMPFYLSKAEIKPQLLLKGDQYKSFVYINGTKNKHVLFNDTERNDDLANTRKKARFASDTKSKLVRLMYLTDNCDAYKYSLKGSDVLPAREYLFDKLAKEYTVALLTVSDYDANSNTFTTLKIDSEKSKNKSVSVVWLQPD